MRTEKRTLIQRGKTVIFVIGSLLALFGFFLDHSAQNEWVVKLFAPGYVQALTAYQRMLENASTIGPSDAGFNEIASICSEKISGPGDLTIASIRVKPGDSFAFKNTVVAEDFVLEVTLQDGRSAAGTIKDLRPQIRESFLEDTLFKWSQGFFLLGIMFVVFEHFVLDRLLPGDS